MGDSNSGDRTADAVRSETVMGDEVMVCRADDVLMRRLLDGLIVLAPNASEPVRVSSPGEVLWSLLDEPCAVGDLVAVWSTIYDLPPDVARGEIHPVLHAWIDVGAVTILSTP